MSRRSRCPISGKLSLGLDDAFLMGSQYVGSADQTVPLKDACSAVRRALNLIRQRVKDALKFDVCFNEILSAAYMEKQSMAVGIPLLIRRRWCLIERTVSQ